MERRGETIVESSVEARQGFLGRPVLVVLVVSCVLAVAALALSFAGVFGHAYQARPHGTTRNGLIRERVRRVRWGRALSCLHGGLGLWPVFVVRHLTKYR
jgi:hypothetical protein